MSGGIKYFHVHIGRSFIGTRLEDGCPCGKAPCGLVDSEKVDPDCPQHDIGQARTMRQVHYPSQCPGRDTPSV